MREVAILGVARVLNVFWEAIPAAAARALVDAIIGELSHDMRSPAVRAAVPAGVAFLLSQVRRACAFYCCAFSETHALLRSPCAMASSLQCCPPLLTSSTTAPRRCVGAWEGRFEGCPPLRTSHHTHDRSAAPRRCAPP